MNENTKTSPVSFYTLSATLNNGTGRAFDQYRGKHVLIVNLASDCGFTGQYEELETLYRRHNNKLVILGFPSNDFGGQEPNSDEAIADFCRVNYGVSFPLFKKDAVKGPDRQPVYKWLSDPAQNGWNSQAPGWNFCKYLVNDQGMLVHFFSSAVSPLAPEIVDRFK